MDITSLLERGQSADAAARNEAEAALRRLEAENYPAYLLSLCNVFNGPNNAVGMQRLAAIILKNTIQSKDANTKATMKSKWTQLDLPTKNRIHRELLRGLRNEEADVCCTVSIVAATVAAIDVPANAWTELVPTLLENMDALPVRVPLQRATLGTMGYLCEELNEMGDVLPPETVDKMLTAICRGMANDVADTAVRLAATEAMLHALEFTEKNFNNEQERNFILTAVGQSALCRSSEAVREVGFECLAKICEIYYPLLSPYMAQVYQLTVDTIQSDEEDVAKQAIEVWSTICDEELVLIKDLREDPNAPNLELHHFAKQACPSLVPVLLDQMTKQEEDQELDECAWTVAMAAGTCLSLMAECAGNDVIPITMPFVQANIKRNEGPDDWRYREAATYAFGAILEGPDEKDLAPIAASGLGFLLGAMKDQDPRVRNTTAWTIGRIFEFVRPEDVTSSILTNENLTDVIQCLLQTFANRDELHILERVCYAIEKLSDWCRKQNAVSLSPFFKDLVTALLKLAFHPTETNARVRVQVAALEAINGLVRAATPDCLDLVVQLIPYFSQKLSESHRSQPSDPEERITEVQALVCGCLTVIFSRLGKSEGHRIPLAQCSGQIFGLLTAVLQAHGSDAAVLEEAMTTFSALVSSGATLDVPIRTFIPHFEKGLRDHSDKYVFLSCVGAVSDLFENVGDRMEPYAQGLLTILCDTLSNSMVRREIKPPVLSLFGNICLAVADRFHKFLPTVQNILRQATGMAMQDQARVDEEDIDYFNHLNLGILEAYTGIIVGLSSDTSGQFLAAEQETLMKFMHFISMDKSRQAQVTAEAIGLMGDIISNTPRFNPDLNQKAWIQSFIQECQASPKDEICQKAERTQVVFNRVCM